MENLKTYRKDCLKTKLNEEKEQAEKDLINLIKSAISEYPIFSEFYVAFNKDFTKNNYIIDNVEDLVVSLNVKKYPNLSINDIYDILENNDFLKSHDIELQSNLTYIFISEKQD
jgi:hypothetical protein|nr:MAG TPA: hypothetical protein [Caudoviricetes sp.]